MDLGLILWKENGIPILPSTKKKKKTPKNMAAAQWPFPYVSASEKFPGTLVPFLVRPHRGRGVVISNSSASGIPIQQPPFHDILLLVTFVKQIPIFKTFSLLDFIILITLKQNFKNGKSGEERRQEIKRRYSVSPHISQLSGSLISSLHSQEQ